MYRSNRALIVAAAFALLAAPAAFGCVCDPVWTNTLQFAPTLTVQSTGLNTARVTASGYAVAPISTGSVRAKICAVSLSWANAPINAINRFALYDSSTAQPLYDFTSNPELNDSFSQLAQEAGFSNSTWQSFSQPHFNLPEDLPVYFAIDVELQRGKTVQDLADSLRAGPCLIATTAFDELGNRVGGHDTVAPTTAADLLPASPTCTKVGTAPIDPIIISDEAF